MIAFPGQLASISYTVESSGALAAANSGPTYTLYKNGSVVDTTSGSPTVTLTASNPATGVYRVSFTVPSGWAANDVIELFAATGTTGSAFVGQWVVLPDVLRMIVLPSNFSALGINSSGHISRVTLVDTTTANTDMRGTDDAATQTSVDAIKVDTGNLVTRITANLFAGVTSIGNWLGALAGKMVDATTLAQINATAAGSDYDNTTDSLQAIRDQGDAEWAGSGGGLTGANSVTITVTDGANPVPGATVRVKAGAATDIQRTDADGVVVFSLDDNTYSVRITAERLSFAPVDLAVAADVATTYAMTEVIVDTTAWADGSDLVAYHDALTIGQMLKDDRTAVDVANVPTHPIVGRLLSLATGEVNSALSVSKRYNADALAAMPDSSLETLRWLTCSIAMWHLRQRRVTTDPEKQARERKILDDYLDRIRRGELVLDIEANKEAGIGEAVPFEQADTQRGTPLLRDRMSGTAGAFPKRRFPQR